MKQLKKNDYYFQFMKKAIIVLGGVLLLNMAAYAQSWDYDDEDDSDYASDYSRTTHQQGVKVFPRPTFEGRRLDWCYSFGSNCGVAAAEAFCRYQGYRGVDGYEKAGSVGPTRTIGSKQNCDNWNNCDGFSFIGCRSGYGGHRRDEHRRGHWPEDRRPATGVFYRPRLEGVSLDWCLSQGWRCGAEPAQIWCRLNGFKRAVDFKSQKSGDITLYIDSREECPGNCTTYRYIRCR